MNKYNLNRIASLLITAILFISACTPNFYPNESTFPENTPEGVPNSQPSQLNPSNNEKNEIWNHYRITYSIILDGYRGITKVWMPVPVNGLTQQNIKLVSVNPIPKNIFYESHGNEIIYWEENIQTDGAVFIEEFDLYLLKKEWNIDPEKIGDYKSNDPVLTQYLKPSSMIQSDEPEVIAMAQEIVGEENNPYNKSLLIVEYMKNNFQQGFTGSEDALKVIRTKGIVGCGSVAFSFVALARAAGVPARVVAGIHSLREGTFNWKENNFGTHLWAEFYLPDYGWVPVDPLWPEGTIFAKSEGNRVILSRDSEINIYYGQDPIPWFHMPYVNGSQEEESALILDVEFIGSENTPGY